MQRSPQQGIYCILLLVLKRRVLLPTEALVRKHTVARSRVDKVTPNCVLVCQVNQLPGSDSVGLGWDI
jgi:hypothetical protein